MRATHIDGRACEFCSHCVDRLLPQYEPQHVVLHAREYVIAKVRCGSDRRQVHCTVAFSAVQSDDPSVRMQNLQCSRSKVVDNSLRRLHQSSEDAACREV